MKIIALLPSTYLPVTIPALQPTISLPDSAIVKNGNPVFLPDFDSSFSAIPFLAVKINRLGKNIAPRFAERYYSEAAPVLVICGDNLLNALRESALPWNSALGFDKSVVTGEFINYSTLSSSAPLSLNVGEISTPLPLPSKEVIANAIYEVSRYNALKMGDYILIPIESEPVHLKIDSMVTVSENEKTILKLPVK